MNVSTIAEIATFLGEVFSPAEPPSMRVRQQYQQQQQQAAYENTLNMIDYQRTQDGWMGSIQDMAGRMSELAVLANDGTKSPSDIAALQAEFSQMQQGIQSVTSGPYAMGKFNGLFLFQG